MMTRRYAVILTALMAAFSSPASAKVLAECGASFGQALYDGESDWGVDRISVGSFRFTTDVKGNPNLHFIDTTGGETDSAADGAKITFSFIHPDLKEFGIVVIYEEQGVVETYNVFRSANGNRRVFWTSNKSKASPLAKVSAFAADCS